MILYIFCYGHSRVLLSILHVFYAACMFYGTAFMYNHAILCILFPILEVEINIIIYAALGEDELTGHETG